MISPATDLRPEFGVVLDQGARPSCLAFAATSTHERHASVGDALCVEYLYFNAVARSGPGGAGCTMNAMQVTLTADGQPLETYWPYLAVQPASGAWVAPPGIGQVWKANSQITKPTFAETAGLVSGGTPVILGLVITDRFMRCGPDGLLPDINPDPVRGGHAVVALGYGTDDKGGEYLLIRNSWGSGWGDKGHAWLGRPYVDAQLKDAVILK